MKKGDPLHQSLFPPSTEYTIRFDEYHTTRIKQTSEALGYENEVEWMINAIKSVLVMRENETTQLYKNREKQQTQERLI